ncbi:MAG: phosphoglucomutase/phosphomannomutase family protein [Bacteroidetes bacterium]|nr:phosphoglucomutase/phosphomannomutase family protein [Bacteroidota bacterium]
MSNIKFGTDGWRAIIGKDFTTQNVARAAQGTAAWLVKQGSRSAVIGYDCRFGGKLFAETVAKVMAANGIKSYISPGFVSTPMVSLATKELNAGVGVIITASHNPPDYNGFKLKGAYGGPLLPEMIKEVEGLIPGVSSEDADKASLADLIKEGLAEYSDFEDLYYRKVVNKFDLQAIKNSGLHFAYDAMYGAGQKIMRRILPDITLLHCTWNPLFNNTPPEPLLKNLGEFSFLIRKQKNIACGLATDGDADRLGLMDSRGNFIDSHHIILLLVHYLCKYKLSPPELNSGLKVVTAFSTTTKLKRLCDHYGLQLNVVPIGFKYICDIILREKDKVLLGGEESGGIALRGHIPERDGIWVGLTLWEFMAKSGKTLKELIKEVYSITGPFVFARNDMHIDGERKEKVIDNCKSGKFDSFGKFKVKRTEDMDGWKYFINDDEWIMVRPSGTEPLLRIYAEAENSKKVQELIKAGVESVMKS